MAKTTVKVCENCGRTFTCTCSLTKYCSEKCRKETNNLCKKLRREKMAQEQKKRRPKKVTAMERLTNDAVEAREHGMSYGEWKAQQYVNTQQNIAMRMRRMGL